MRKLFSERRSALQSFGLILIAITILFLFPTIVLAKDREVICKEEAKQPPPLLLTKIFSTEGIIGESKSPKKSDSEPYYPTINVKMVKTFTESLPSWLTPIATIFLAGAAIFSDRIKYLLFRRPNLKILFESDLPYIIEFLNPGRGPTNRVRLGILNKGKGVAKKCRLKIIEIIDIEKGPAKDFDPVFIPWAGAAFKSIDISNEECEYADLFFAEEGNKAVAIFHDRELSTVNLSREGRLFRIEYERGRYLLKPGKYIIKIRLYGENFQPVSKKLRLDWTGDWKKINLKKI